MKTSLDYLIAAREKTKADSFTDLAKRLTCTRPAISQYYAGKRVMDDYTAAQVAKILGIPEIEVITAANADRETNPERKKWWENFYKKLTKPTTFLFYLLLSIHYAQLCGQLDLKLLAFP